MGGLEAKSSGRFFWAAVTRTLLVPLIGDTWSLTVGT